MVIAFKEEPFDAVYDDAIPLMRRHWEEIASNREKAPLAPNVPAYVQADERGCLSIVTARDDGKLIGYCAYFILRPEIGGHAHYSTTPFAESDVIWLDPDYRSLTIGRQMVGASMAALAARGVVIVNTRTKLAHPQLAALLEILGHEETERVFTKVLG